MELAIARSGGGEQRVRASKWGRKRGEEFARPVVAGVPPANLKTCSRHGCLYRIISNSSRTSPRWLIYFWTLKSTEYFPSHFYRAAAARITVDRDRELIGC